MGGGLGLVGGWDEVGNDWDVRWNGSRNEMKDGISIWMVWGEEWDIGQECVYLVW